MQLSICIPTYNREQYLGELLRSLLPQLEALPVGTVELLISDNRSVDGTASLCRSFDLPFLRFWINETNIGGDRNFLKCIRAAAGDYVWLIGDDELVAPHAVERILAALSRCNPVLLIADALASADGSVFEAYQDLLAARPRNFALVHTLISANVFKRKCFDLDFATSKLWTQYAHMFGIVNALRGKRVVAMSNLIEVRRNRADFAKYPSFLCVKQCLYVGCLARRLGMRALFVLAATTFCRLPLEFASRVKNYIVRNILRR